MATRTFPFDAGAFASPEFAGAAFDFFLAVISILNSPEGRFVRILTLHLLLEKQGTKKVPAFRDFLSSFVIFLQQHATLKVPPGS